MNATSSIARSRAICAFKRGWPCYLQKKTFFLGYFSIHLFSSWLVFSKIRPIIDQTILNDAL